MNEPVAVRLGRGPLHLAFPISERQLVSVCGGRFGVASVAPTRAWKARRARRCPECAEAAAHARTGRILAMIAGL